MKVKKDNRTTIIVAIIGLIGVIATASLNFLGPQRATETSIEATKEAEATLTSVAIAIPALTPTQPLVIAPTIEQISIQSEKCNVVVDDIIFAQRNVEPGQSVQVAVVVQNPDNVLLKMHWSSGFGTMNPALNSTLKESTYTAPSQSQNDSIIVTVEAENCNTSQFVKTVNVISLNKTATIIPITPNPTSTPISSTISTLSPTPTNQLVNPDYQVHIVQSGELLSTISEFYNLSVGEIILANELINADLIEVGQGIRIPSISRVTVPPIVSVKNISVVNRGPNKDSGTIDWLTYGHSGVVVGYSNAWYYVCFGTTEGWVPLDGVRFVDSIPIDFSTLPGVCSNPHWQVFE